MLRGLAGGAREPVALVRLGGEVGHERGERVVVRERRRLGRRVLVVVVGAVVLEAQRQAVRGERGARVQVAACAGRAAWAPRAGGARAHAGALVVVVVVVAGVVEGVGAAAALGEGAAVGLDDDGGAVVLGGGVCGEGACEGGVWGEADEWLEHAGVDGQQLCRFVARGGALGLGLGRGPLQDGAGTGTV